MCIQYYKSLHSLAVVLQTQNPEASSSSAPGHLCGIFLIFIFNLNPEVSSLSTPRSTLFLRKPLGAPVWCVFSLRRLAWAGMLWSSLIFPPSLGRPKRLQPISRSNEDLQMLTAKCETVKFRRKAHALGANYSFAFSKDREYRLCAANSSIR